MRSLKKILVHPKNIPKKSKNSKDFFEDLKSVYLIWEWTSNSVFKSFFYLLNPRSPKKNHEKNQKKSEKNLKNLKISKKSKVFF